MIRICWYRITANSHVVFVVQETSELDRNL